MPDINVFESVGTSERLTTYRMEDFADFVRGYPFVEITMSNQEVLEFENGVEQITDFWAGRTKKQFEITFPVSHKIEALPIRQYYESRIGHTFLFTSPIDGITRKVRFVNDTYKLERRHFDTYFAGVVLREVF